MFSMLSDSQDNKTGTGLGLYISKQISQKLTYQDGEGLVAESVYNKGSTFSFLLEAKNPSDKAQNNLEYELTSTKDKPQVLPKPYFRIPSGSFMKCNHPPILIVDDDVANIYALNLILKKYGFLCDSTHNGLEAIKMIKKREASTTCDCNYKLVLMDCNMPVMDGYQACQEIK